MSRVAGNVVSNMVGRVWTSVLAIVLVPLYVKSMSIEAYALVAFYTSLQLFLNIFDLGLTSTTLREMARHSAPDAPKEPARNLLRTLESVYWAIGIVIGVGITLLSPVLAENWLNAETLGVDVVARCVAIMGCVFAFQWPLTLYTGALLGLQHQVLLNAINVTFGTFRGIGSLLVLLLISPTPVAFFTFQIVASILHTAALAIAVWRRIPAPGRPRFDPSVMRSLYKFAAGMTLISVVVLVLGQVDKIVLSKMLSLEAFGYYSISATAAGALFMGAAPFADALLPRYSRLAAEQNAGALASAFHEGCQYIATFVYPAAAILAVFPAEVLMLWIGDAKVVAHARLVLAMLAVATTMNVLMGMMDALQTAYGWLKPALYVRIGALLIGGPLLVWMASSRREVGAAAAWLIVFSAYALITPHFVFGRLLPGEKWSWYGRDVLVPMLAAAATAIVWKLLIAAPASRVGLALYLALAGIAATVAVAATTPAPLGRVVRWKEGLWASTR